MDDFFISNGFSQFEPPSIYPVGVETCFQKRYDDDVGKKYFITVLKWEPMTHPYTLETTPSQYEYEVQLYNNIGHDALDLNFHSSWTLDQVEDYLEKLWNTGLFDYYEKFEY